MSEFEDNLWLEVMREFERAEPTVRRPRRTVRPQLLAGTTVGVVAIATAAALLLDASTSPPAFAVTRNPNGTVTVNLRQLSGVAGVNEKLAAMGVRAQVVASTKSAPALVCPGGTAPTITFNPSGVPKGRVLMISPGQANAGDAAALKTGPGGASVGGTAGTDTGGNHVVRMYPGGGGSIRTGSGGGNHVARMYCA